MKRRPHPLLRLLSPNHVLTIPLLRRNSRLMTLRSTEGGVAVFDVLHAGCVEWVWEGAGLN